MAGEDMASVPAEEAIELYNKIVHTAPSDVGQLAQMEWRLRSLLRRRPGDLPLGVAHLETLMLLGRATEAIDASNRLWPHLHSMGSEQLQTYFTQVFHLGMYDRVIEASEIIDRRGITGGVPNWVGLHVQTFLETGDYARFSELLDRSPAELVVAWRRFRDELNEIDLVPHLRMRSKIILEETLGKQTLQSHLLAPETSFPIVLTHYVHTSGSYEERTALEDRIRQRLDDYFAEVGGLTRSHWELMCEVVIPITAAWPRHSSYADSRL